MIVNFEGKRFEFSECDTKGRTQEEFLPEEVADELYECMVELEGDEDV